MLVEINLLPEKEPKKYRTWLLVSGFGALLLLICAYFYIQVHSVKTNIESVDQQISLTKKMVEKSSSRSNSANTANNSAINQLKAAADWAKSYPIQTIPVMQHLVSLLPERGFIQTFTYSESGDIQVSVQFDSSSDAAYFLDNLNSAKWIKEAKLTSLTAGNVPNTTNSNQAAGSNTLSAETANSTNTAANSQTASGSQTPASSQENHPVGGNSTAGSSNAANTGTSSAIANSSTNNSVSDNYMPRYTGQFTITLNKDAAKKLMIEGQNDATSEQGVNGS